jgi:hypothetical protein
MRIMTWSLDMPPELQGEFSEILLAAPESF